MPDNFASHSPGLTAPAARHLAVTPNDGADIAFVPRALYCSVAGSAVLRDAAGTDVTYQLLAGQVLPFRPRRVLATGTTAALIAWE